MPWYHGPALLEHLETVEIDDAAASAPFRFPVQRVSRPDRTIPRVRGADRVGRDASRAMKSRCVRTGRKSRVKSITTFDGDLEEAWAPMSVTLTLEDELDISRGDLIACGSAAGGVAALRGDAGVVQRARARSGAAVPAEAHVAAGAGGDRGDQASRERRDARPRAGRDPGDESHRRGGDRNHAAGVLRSVQAESPHRGSS